MRWLVRVLVTVVASGGCARDVVVGSDLGSEPRPDAAEDPRDASASNGADAAPNLPPTTWPWVADHEQGNLGQWTLHTRDLSGGLYRSVDAEQSVSSVQRHGGQYAIEMRATVNDQNVRYVRIFRQGALPAAARYRAWFFLPQSYSVQGYWNLMQFSAPDVLLWDMTMVNRQDGRRQLSVFDQVRREDRRATVAHEVPAGRWFEIAVELRRTVGAPTRLRLFLDGVLLLELDDLVEPPGMGWLQWNVGIAAVRVTPPLAVVHIDDARIEPL